ncbi:MAG TPA: phosphotransferase [Marivita sp.]|nr:phosphotransferase [Marivita sp.]
MTSIDVFLAENGWSDGARTPLAGDASARRYIRLCSGAKRAILMIDPQDDTDRFVRMAGHLSALGLSAPTIMAHAPGLLLLEDFGDAQFATVIAEDQEQEIPLYRAATDVLCHLERSACPGDLSRASAAILGQMIDPVFTHYVPAMCDEPAQDSFDVIARLTALLEDHVPSDSVLVLRDFHAENMIWLPDREGITRVGLLDFQDAVKGPPIYDLVSMLQDARRDVSEACHAATLAHYVGQTGRTMDQVLPVFHLLGLQRNLRILGIFARLAVERGKPGYLDLIPRVWAHVQTSLNDPVSAPLKPILDRMLPTPTHNRLRKVKARCLTP